MLDNLELKILNYCQKNFPLVSRPFLSIAETFGQSESDIIDLFNEVKNNKYISRIGPIFKPNTIGASTLAAFKVDAKNLDEVAETVSSFSCVNHNYAREHEFNLWFVVTAKSREMLDLEIKNIEQAVKLEALVLPLVKEYYIDLGFDLESENE